MSRKGSRSNVTGVEYFLKKMETAVDNTLLGLYRNHVLGDGHGLGAVTPAAATEKAPEVVAPESAVQHRKRVHHDRAQAREIDKKIKEFSRLGPCDHD